LKPQLAKRAAFAEVAEAVGVTTDAVLGMSLIGENQATVYYTPGDGQMIWRARLRRDVDGILQLAEVPRQTVAFDELLESLTESEEEE
jgi:hypothetical protein